MIAIVNLLQLLLMCKSFGDDFCLKPVVHCGNFHDIRFQQYPRVINNNNIIINIMRLQQVSL